MGAGINLYATQLCIFYFCLEWIMVNTISIQLLDVSAPLRIYQSLDKGVHCMNENFESLSKKRMLF